MASHVGTPTYRAFHAFKDRVRRGNNTPGSVYEGVVLSKRWATFGLFLADMGEKPSPAHTLYLKPGSKVAGRKTVRWRNTKKVRISRATTHGKSSSITFTSWRAMINRCHNPNDASYGRYGKAGIKVCRRWRLGENGQSGFSCFLADMGERPSTLHTLDRKDGSKGYRLSNCRWATTTEQRENQSSRIVMVTYQGRTQSLMAWAIETGIVWATLRSRIKKGWPINDVFSNTNAKSGRPLAKAKNLSVLNQRSPRQ